MAAFLMNDSSKTRVLVVEDDIEFSQWMDDYLTSHGMECQCAATGQAALRAIADAAPNVVILDGGLPDIDGFEVCRKIKASHNIPVIVLTARDEEVDEVMGLEAGADDYLTKPVRARALLVRIQRLIDRESTTGTDLLDNPTNVLCVNGVQLCWGSRTATHSGTEVYLSSQEFELLWILVSNAGNVVGRNQLVEALRGFEFDGFDRSIDLRISRLRRKLCDDPANACLIKTIRGKGYLFSAKGAS